MEFLSRALALLERVPVIDTHSHFLINGHFLNKKFNKRHRPPRSWNPLRNTLDLPRLKEAQVSCCTFAVYVPIPPLRLSAWKSCQRILDTLDQIVADNGEAVSKVASAQEIRQAHAQGKLAILPAVEGGHVIGSKLERLAGLRERGVRILTIAHFLANQIADACVGPKIYGGLSDFGQEVVRRCEQLGLVVDLSHCSDAAFAQSLEVIERPPMATHVGLRCGRPRELGLTDDQIRGLAARGGALGIIWCRGYVMPHSFFRGLDVIADAYCRVADLVGAKHLMLGTDLDGYSWPPRGMRDICALPRLIALLMERGFRDDELIGILGGNALRILESCENQCQDEGSC